MLNINKNIIFIVIIYILLLFVELFHFGSDVYIIIMSESFLCFSILLYIVSFIFQEMFVSGLYIITLKYNYIYIFFKNIINLNTHVYTIFINAFSFFLFFFIKNFKLIENLKNSLKLEYLSNLIFIKKNFNNFFKNYNFNLSLFI